MEIRQGLSQAARDAVAFGVGQLSSDLLVALGAAAGQGRQVLEVFDESLGRANRRFRLLQLFAATKKKTGVLEQALTHRR